MAPTAATPTMATATTTAATAAAAAAAATTIAATTAAEAAPVATTEGLWVRPPGPVSRARGVEFLNAVFGDGRTTGWDLRATTEAVMRRKEDIAGVNAEINAKKKKEEKTNDKKGKRRKQTKKKRKNDENEKIETEKKNKG